MSDAYDDEDDFMVDDEVYDIEYSSDSAESGDYQFENIYYGAKSIKDEDWRGAVEKFEEVISSESEKGEWGFKCHKQICKLYFRHKQYDKFLKTFESLTGYVQNAITRNYSEKSLYSILEYVSAGNACTPAEIQHKLYSLILDQLDTGALPHERLWFKTKVKLCKLYLQERQFQLVQNICQNLNEWCEKLGAQTITPESRSNTQESEGGVNAERKASQTSISLNSSRHGGHLLEIYALEIQMCTEQRNNKRLKELYTRALSVRSAICNALDQGIIRECGGKMHLREMAYNDALTDFFEAFKCYDECGSSRRIQSIKYVVLASMLSNSDINPFDSQEAKPYKNNPEVKTMTQLVSAYQKKDSIQFEQVLNENLEALKGDDFIWEYCEKLCKNIRISSIVNICKTTEKLHIDDLASQMCVQRREVEQAVIKALLEARIEGFYDQVNGILQVKNAHCEKISNSESTTWTNVESSTITTTANNSSTVKHEQVINKLSRMIGKWSVAQENLQNKLIHDIMSS